MPLTGIDDKVVRVDAEAKARGEAKYVSDYVLPDMLYACMVRSSVPRARITGIHLPELPEGYYFISAKDIPENGRNELWMIAKDWRCFADGDVRYVGETIGLLVGKDRNILRYLQDNTRIDYEEGVPAVTIDDAIALKGGPIVGEDNVMCSLFCEKGRPMKDVFNEADSVFEETIETGFQEHVHLETNGAVITEEDGRYVNFASAQCPLSLSPGFSGSLRRISSSGRRPQVARSVARSIFPMCYAGRFSLLRA